MSKAEYFAKIAKDRDPRLSDAVDVLKMARDGDVLHIDGAFIRALADLSDTGKATYCRREIKRDKYGYVVTDGSDYGTAFDALEALLMAEDSLAGKPVLAEPEPASAPDDSAYRKQMREAGRGELLG
jgi:hypothetical protein